ncbi:MAG TPA: hypothetical protein VE093_23815 [Polyangiaceae bacterium]|nr:hypothetical protein [Polyangiaceae bacterium]
MANRAQRSASQCKSPAVVPTQVAKGFSCQSLNTASFCGLAAECEPGSAYYATCEGTTVVFCNAGRIEKIDCTTLGFTGCHTMYGEGACSPGLYDSLAKAACADDADCGGMVGACLFETCEDAACVVVDLTDPATPLPTDPDSGLPIGNGCKN